MTRVPEPQTPDTASEESERILFHLFVTGDEENSRAARSNLERLCREHLGDRCQVVVVDILVDIDRALAEKVFVTPTLKVIEPRQAVFYGNLADPSALLQLLGGG